MVVEALNSFVLEVIYMRKRVLIIGVSGLLGGRLFQLGKEKYEIYGTYNDHPMKGENVSKLDVTSKQDVFSLVGSIKPDLIIDMHAINNVDKCETDKDEAWKVNVDGTRNVVEAATTYGSKFVFMSTDYVFDGKKMGYGEKDKPEPATYYGKTKIISEKIVEALDANYIILRSSVIYGNGGMNKKNFVTWVIENLKQRKEIRVVIDQFNKPTFADDIADIIYALYEKDASGLFHAVGSDYINRYEFACRIADKFNLDKGLIKPITTPDLNQVSPRPMKLYLSTDKIERIVGRSLVGIDSGLESLKNQIEE